MICDSLYFLVELLNGGSTILRGGREGGEEGREGEVELTRTFVVVTCKKATFFTTPGMTT